MTHTYIDEEISGKVVDYLGCESDYHELSFVHLENATFNLSLSNGYIEFLKGYKESDGCNGMYERKNSNWIFYVEKVDF